MRRAWMILAIAVGLGLSGCASPTSKVIESTEPAPAQRATIEAAIRVRLKDPESARFGEFKAGRAPEGITVCGQVNSKNSFGGYAGMSTFFGSLRGNAFYRNRDGRSRRLALGQQQVRSGRARLVDFLKRTSPADVDPTAIAYRAHRLSLLA